MFLYLIFGVLYAIYDMFKYWNKEVTCNLQGDKLKLKYFPSKLLALAFVINTLLGVPFFVLKVLNNLFKLFRCKDND